MTVYCRLHEHIKRRIVEKTDFAEFIVPCKTVIVRLILIFENVLSCLLIHLRTVYEFLRLQLDILSCKKRIYHELAIREHLNVNRTGC